ARAGRTARVRRVRSGGRRHRGDARPLARARARDLRARGLGYGRADADAVGARRFWGDDVHAGLALARRVARVARASRVPGDRLLRLVRPPPVPRRRRHGLDRPPPALTLGRVPGTVPRPWPFRARSIPEAGLLLDLRP